MADSPQAPICCIEKCDRYALGDLPFCLTHLTDHIGKALSVEQREKLTERLNSVLNTLSYREREVMKLRYGLHDGYIFKQSEVGRIFKVSASTISRVEARAIRKLQQPSRARQLADCIPAHSFAIPDSNVIEVVKTCDEEILKYVAKHPDLMHHLKPDAFERIIAEIMKSAGWEVELTQRTRDGGRDIIAVRTDCLGIPTKYIVECKRYASDNPVRVELVRALFGVKIAEEADHAILATTSRFTPDAVKFLELPHVWNLHLKGFEEITGWVRQYDELRGKKAILL